MNERIGDVAAQQILENVRAQGIELTYVSEKTFELSQKKSENPVFTSYATNQGSTMYKFYDDGITNLMEITANGDVYLDGSPVMIESYDENKTLISSKIANVYEIAPRAHQVKKMQNLPSGVSDSDLKEDRGTTTHVVSIGERVWKDVSVAVIIAILTLPVIGLWSVLAAGVGQAIVSAAKASTPYSNHLSFKKHERMGRFLGGYTLIVRTYIQYYGNDNFTGYLGSSTYYTGYKG